jgi:hypothetical protein
MNKKQLIFAWVITAILFFVTISLLPINIDIASAQRSISIWEVARTTLRLVCDGGRVSGYVMFFDKDANQCGIYSKYGALSADLFYIMPEDEKRFYAQKTEIKLKRITFRDTDFKNLELKNGDIVYALRIEPFLLPKEAENEFGVASVGFQLFERGSIRAVDHLSCF